MLAVIKPLPYFLAESRCCAVAFRSAQSRIHIRPGWNPQCAAEGCAVDRGVRPLGEKVRGTPSAFLWTSGEEPRAEETVSAVCHRQEIRNSAQLSIIEPSWLCVS